MVVSTILAGQAAERGSLAGLQRNAGSALSLRNGLLLAEMRKQSALPLALASDPEITAAVQAKPPHDVLEGIDRRLAQIAAATGAAVIYVIGADGITVAASNAGEPRSFVGQDYRFRPYFRQAMEDGAGSMFALGTVSGRPGFYFSRRTANSPGVVVVKVEFDGVEAAWRETGDITFVTDSRGIVLVTSEASWRFKVVAPIDPGERRRIDEGLEFGKAPLEELPLRAVEGMPGVVHVARGSGRAWLALQVEASVPDTNWVLHTLTPIAAVVERERLQAAIIAALVSSMVCLGLAALVDRGRRTRLSLAQAAARGEELEANVRERTRALSEANTLLRAEIEERRRAEAERERLGQELAQAGRLAALGQFAASMAHEINQPLAAIRSYADNTAILVRRGRIEEATENAFAIGRLTDRIAGLTRQLKGFARRASPRREPVALREVLTPALEIVSGRAATLGVSVEVDDIDRDTFVLGDGPRLEQVVVNLLQNAIDAVEHRREGRVCLRLVEGDAGRLAVLVIDNGLGIPDAMRSQVFDAFFTTKSDGLGLGLAIARGIVEDCGGNLILDRGGADGTIFRMELIRAEGQRQDDKFGYAQRGAQ